MVNEQVRFIACTVVVIVLIISIYAKFFLAQAIPVIGPYEFTMASICNDLVIGKDHGEPDEILLQACDHNLLYLKGICEREKASYEFCAPSLERYLTSRSLLNATRPTELFSIKGIPIDYTNLATYADTGSGFEIKYPEGWNITKFPAKLGCYSSIQLTSPENYDALHWESIYIHVCNSSLEKNLPPLNLFSDYITDTYIVEYKTIQLGGINATKRISTDIDCNPTFSCDKRIDIDVTKDTREYSISVRQPSIANSSNYVSQMILDTFKFI